MLRTGILVSVLAFLLLGAVADARSLQPHGLLGGAHLVHYCFILDQDDPMLIPDLAGEVIPREPEPTILRIADAELPDQLSVWADSIPPQACGLLYVMISPNGPTANEFPLEELAKIVNGIDCAYLITVIDLPTSRAKRTLTGILAARERYELFHNSMTIFTSGSYQPRIWLHSWSTFADYFFRFALRGYADTNDDGMITLWEAYEYAFWCTYTHAIKETGHPQTALYRAPQAEQPVLVSARSPFYLEQDPMRLLFAEVTIGYYTPMGPAGAAGPVGPAGLAWMSWLQGPVPAETGPGVFAKWTGSNVGLVGERSRQATSVVEALEKLTYSFYGLPRRLPPSPQPSRWVLSVHIPSGPAGPMGPPAPASAQATHARHQAISRVPDPQERSVAETNDRLLAEVGELALELERRLSQLTVKAIFHYTQIASCPSPQCATPQEWPSNLGSYPPWISGPQGPPGPTGKAFQDLQLADSPIRRIESESLTAELERELQRLRRAEKRMQRLEARWETP